MADKKISALTAATTPLAGTEVLPIVQSSTTKKVATDDLTVKNLRSNATTGILQVAGPAAAATRVMTVPDANFTAARTDAAQTFTGAQTIATIKSATSLTPTAFQDSAGVEIGKLCRAWVYFDGTTAPPTIKQSFNVTSVSKSAGTGTYDITITNALPNAEPTVVTGYRKTSAFNEILDVIQDSNTATNVRVRNTDITGVGADSKAVFVGVFA
ncbi:MAG: hypothetical protein EBR82_50975 [Caulobacteraceae bacterium]|nr:hypothetical protein [Caulobacteraceae bacterium]